MRLRVLSWSEAAARPPRGWAALALLWLLLLGGLALHQWRFWQAPAIDTDVLALLPQSAEDAHLSGVAARIAEASARRVVVLLGARDAEAAGRAQAALDAALKLKGAGLEAAEPMQDWFAQARDFYAPWRNRLLTAGQRAELAQADPQALAEAAVARLYGPLGGSLLGWRHDPLGLWPAWWQARAAAAGLALEADGLLRAHGRYWAVSLWELRDSAFRLDGRPQLSEALAEAVAAARAVAPDLAVLRAGVPLHAEAAAVGAHREINTIGWGSLAAVLILVWSAFRSPRPLLLVAASLLIGCAVGLSVTLLLFGRVHLLTLVFGASLVGVAEDYGIHWFAARQEQPHGDRWRLLRRLLPGLALALATSAVAYLALGLAPFPGLRQMAVFSVAGLCGAFLSSILWFPWLDRRAPRRGRIAAWMQASLARWPRLQARRFWLLPVLGFALFTGVGLGRLQVSDDLRSLQSSPPALLAEQAEAGRLLGLPSPAQFFLVRGPDVESVLQREEALVRALARLQAEGALGGWRALSDWVPSIQRQQADAALTRLPEQAALEAARVLTGEALEPAAADPGPLRLEHWLAAPLSQPLRSLWLGPLGTELASVVMLDDPARSGSLAPLQALPLALQGVRWVDRAADYTRLLAHYRNLMGGLLGLGSLAVFALLLLRYRALAWRVMLPTWLAMAATLALFGWIGQPLQLFGVLGLILLLGMGIDYGIFLVEHRDDASAWMAVCVGAASTWLSFGLLALSATPALRAFGLSLLCGIGLVWLLSPLFRPAPSSPPG